MIEIIEEFGDPVPIVGQEGTMVLFHPNIVHCSGHNMSRHSRWHVFIGYNQVKNHPETVPNPRPDWAVSRDYRPVEKGTERDLVQLENMMGKSITRKRDEKGKSVSERVDLGSRRDMKKIKR